jgi:hypothetical protein
MPYTRVLKFVAGGFAVFLMLLYLSPVVWKLKQPALTVVVLVGVAMMLVDLWQSLKAKEE